MKTAKVIDGEIQTACTQACPTDALVFGNFNDEDSKVSKMKKDDRHYTLLPHLATDPNVVYLAKVDTDRISRRIAWLAKLYIQVRTPIPLRTRKAITSLRRASKPTSSRRS